MEEMSHLMSYNTIIDGFFKEGDSDKAYSTFHGMLDRRILPNVVTYNSIIAPYARVKQWKRPWSLVHGFCSSGQLTEAIRFFEKMCSDGVEPNVVTYTVLMDYLCKNGEPEILGRFLILCTLLHGYAIEGALVEMHDLFDLMVRSDMRPNHHVLNILICAFSKQGKVDKAMLVFSKMRQQGLSPDVVTYRTVIDILCKLGGVHDAMHNFEQMNSEGVTLISLFIPP
uniref:Pentacotripeptide-repeat region of PRORP domain-containing protein n=1 Tax=Oryza punctata TaxID=4537 RepID=A0A0E0M9B4_ORYPU